MKKQIGISVDQVLWGYFIRSCKESKIRRGPKIEELIIEYLKPQLKNIQKTIKKDIQDAEKKIKKDIQDLERLEKELKIKKGDINENKKRK